MGRDKDIDNIISFFKLEVSFEMGCISLYPLHVQMTFEEIKVMTPKQVYTTIVVSLSGNEIMRCALLPVPLSHVDLFIYAVITGVFE